MIEFRIGEITKNSGRLGGLHRLCVVVLLPARSFRGMTRCAGLATDEMSRIVSPSSVLQHKAGAAEAAAKSAAQIVADRLPSLHDPNNPDADPAKSTDPAATKSTSGIVPKTQPTLHSDRYTPGSAPPAASLTPGAQNATGSIRQNNVDDGTTDQPSSTANSPSATPKKTPKTTQPQTQPQTESQPN